MEEDKENTVKSVSFSDVKQSEARSRTNSHVQNEDGETPKKPVRPKSAGVLKNKSFEPPRIDTLQKATQYRLSLSAKPKNISPKVTVKRRRKLTDASSGSENESEQLRLKGYVPQEVDNGPGYFDPTEDYDFDCDDTPRFGFADHEENHEQRSQAVYRIICKSLHVTPSTLLHNGLAGDCIKLKHHLLGEKGTKALATALVDNVSVRELYLQDNDIRDEGTIYIADMLRENLHVNDLALSENSIGSKGLKSLMKTLENNENIVTLNLSGNNFDEYDAVHIANMLEENTIIRELDLSHNKFREKGGVIIGHALGCNDAIEKLNLSWNHLRRQGVVAVAEALSRNISITDLNVAWNGFYLDGCRALMKSLRDNKILEKLDLTCNRIDFECLQALLKGLSGNSTLQHLYLANNPLSSDGAFLLIKTIYDKAEMKIEYLDISTQIIDVKFLKILEEVRERQVIHVKHGIIMDQDGTDGNGLSEFSHEDPMMVLMELMRIMHLRLIDLFSQLDKDQNRSLSAEELKNGLMSIHVPMTEKAVERLVKKLDIDGDGEVDFGELLEGQKLHVNKLRRLKQLEADLPFAETELGRINMKLSNLMSSGRAQAMQQAEEQRLQRARDRLIAMGLSGSDTNLNEPKT